MRLIDYPFPGGIAFPHPLSDPAEAGLLAIGGELTPARLLFAYGMGIFPWYGPGDPILWWSPDPRFVLKPGQLRVSRSLRRTLNRSVFDIRYDTAFDEVVDGCAKTERPGQEGTWILPEMSRAYKKLHRLGWAHSAEAWREGRLVGGLYGVAAGRIFFGESMFARETDASKAAFVHLVHRLEARGYRLIDCQQETAHLRSFGADMMPGPEFFSLLRENWLAPSENNRWTTQDVTGLD